MNRMEFVQVLRRSLSGKMSYQEVNEHIEYYENYFDEAGPENEQEVLPMENRKERSWKSWEIPD